MQQAMGLGGGERGQGAGSSRSKHRMRRGGQGHKGRTGGRGGQDRSWDVRQGQACGFHSIAVKGHDGRGRDVTRSPVVAVESPGAPGPAALFLPPPPAPLASHTCVALDGANPTVHHHPATQLNLPSSLPYPTPCLHAWPCLHGPLACPPGCYRRSACARRAWPPWSCTAG